MSYQIFKKAFFWNSLNVLAYKIILQLHQWCLFYVISKELFGICGILFSTIYLLVNVTNFGFDYSLFGFYRFFTQSKQNFFYLIHHIMVRLITLLLITAFLLYLFYYFSDIAQVAFIIPFVSSRLLITLTSIFISENIKKTLELFAHLAFLNRSVTIIDIFALLGYISSIWISFFIYGSINLYTIFIPMAVASWIEIIMIMRRIFNFYIQLPDYSNTDQTTPNIATLYKNQMINYVNQLTKSFFSPNFMILFISYYIGIIQAGYIKVIIDTIILLYMLLHKAVGIPSAALMSQASGLQQTLSTEFKNIFLKISNAYIQFLYSLIILFTFFMSLCYLHLKCIHETLPIIIITFTFVGFLEYLILLYEKLFLTKHKEYLLAWINLACVGMLFIILSRPWPLPKYLILMPFGLIRALSAVAIISIAKKIWRLTPIFYPKAQTLLISASIATIAFLAHFFIKIMITNVAFA